MITRLDALKNQKRAKNASKMIKFPCDISPCNIPPLSHAIWIAAILRYTILCCISVWVPIVFYVPYCQAIFFCNISYCMLHWCKIPLNSTHGEIHHCCDIVQDLTGSSDVTLLNVGVGHTRRLLSSANGTQWRKVTCI